MASQNPAEDLIKFDDLETTYSSGLWDHVNVNIYNYNKHKNVYFFCKIRLHVSALYMITDSRSFVFRSRYFCFLFNKSSFPTDIKRLCWTLSIWMLKTRAIFSFWMGSYKTAKRKISYAAICSILCSIYTRKLSKLKFIFQFIKMHVILRTS